MAVVRVGSFRSRTEAELARGMLDAHGYATQVSDSTDTAYGTGAALGGGICLLADEHEADEIRRMLDEVRAAPAESAEHDPHRSPFEDARRASRGLWIQRALLAALLLYAGFHLLESATG
jgi:hypothetical protein